MHSPSTCVVACLLMLGVFRFCSAEVVLSANFEDNAPGVFGQTEIATAFRLAQGPSSVQGDGRARVEAASPGNEAYPNTTTGRFLRIRYPAGAVGSNDGGAQFKVPLPAGRSFNELFLRYRVRFNSGFDFVLGGKLPGLCGGGCNSGGLQADGTDGWSMRNMWRRGGVLVQYAYYADMPGVYGEDFPYDRNIADVHQKPARFIPGQWHTVEHRIKLNAVGAKDGVVEGWLDGSRYLQKQGLSIRTVSSLNIDTLYFSTFFGGGTPPWAPVAEELVDFDDIEVATTRIGPSDLLPPPTYPPSPALPAGYLVHVTFDTTPVGPYTLSRAYLDFGHAGTSTDGLDASGRTTVEEEAGNKYLRVRYPTGGWGPDDSGAQWRARFDWSGRYTELWSQFRLRFHQGFRWAKGGMIPGLCGGMCNNGFERPNGTDGWSARTMWRSEGRAVQFVYHVDQVNDYGDDFSYNFDADNTATGRPLYFSAERWYAIETRIKLNTPGNNDGEFEAWLDGDLVLRRNNMRFRTASGVAIDTFFFSTFFGGTGDEWAAQRVEHVDFDDIRVTTARTTTAAPPPTTARFAAALQDPDRGPEWWLFGMLAAVIVLALATCVMCCFVASAWKRRSEARTQRESLVTSELSQGLLNDEQESARDAGDVLGLRGELSEATSEEHPPAEEHAEVSANGQPAEPEEVAETEGEAEEPTDVSSAGPPSDEEATKPTDAASCQEEHTSQPPADDTSQQDREEKPEALADSKTVEKPPTTPPLEHSPLETVVPSPKVEPAANEEPELVEIAPELAEPEVPHPAALKANNTATEVQEAVPPPPTSTEKPAAKTDEPSTPLTGSAALAAFGAMPKAKAPNTQPTSQVKNPFATKFGAKS